MSEKATKSKVKDLDPKDRAQNVKGGCLCCVDVERLAASAVEDGKDKANKTFIPR